MGAAYSLLGACPFCTLWLAGFFRCGVQSAVCAGGQVCLQLSMLQRWHLQLTLIVACDACLDQSAMLPAAVCCTRWPGGDAVSAYVSALVSELTKSGSLPLSTLASKVRSRVGVCECVHCIFPRSQTRRAGCAAASCSLLNCLLWCGGGGCGSHASPARLARHAGQSSASAALRSVMGSVRHLVLCCYAALVCPHMHPTHVHPPQHTRAGQEAC